MLRTHNANIEYWHCKNSQCESCWSIWYNIWITLIPFVSHLLVFSNTAPYSHHLVLNIATGTRHPWKSYLLGTSHHKMWHRLSADESRGLEPACGSQTRGRKDSQERVHTFLQGMHAFRENKQNAGKLSEDHFLTAVFHSFLEPRDEEHTTMELMAFW